MHPILFFSILGVYLSGFLFFTYFCLLADPNDSRIAHFLTVDLPRQFSNGLASLVGRKLADEITLLSDYSFVLVYLVVVLGSWSIIFFFVYPWVTATDYIGQYNKTIGVVVFIACMTSWRYASGVSPGIITARNLAQYDNYPYDEVLFNEGKICPTVGIPKLARSKFDRYSGVHIAKFDHFCGWLHNPIGEENYRWFLLFLFVHVGMCAYGTAMTGLLFLGEIREKKLWDVTFYNMETGHEFKADNYVVFQYLFQRHTLEAGVHLLMLVMTVMLGLFLGWHVWVASRGMTTNETVKWDAVKKWHKRETKRFKKAMKEGLMTPDGQSIEREQENIVPDGDVTCSGGAPTTETETDENDEDEVYNPGPFPKNIYNLGLYENWKDIIWPRSLRPEALERRRTTPPYQVTRRTVTTKRIPPPQRSPAAEESNKTK